MTFVGTLALGLLVWYAGDLIEVDGFAPLADPARRVQIIAALLVSWALAQTIGVIRARRRDGQLIERLGGLHPEAAASFGSSADEVETLEHRFRDAFRLLKSGRTRRRLGGRSVSQLPWYLIVGPPGCGKTTALINSGLSFPLAEDLGKGPVQGVGGTRNCDWWFAKDAVLLDTAGRYTTQDSYEQVDRAGWQEFLGLLTRYRPRRPVNGVFVAVSVADVLQQSPTERDAQALAISRRLQELQDSFSIRFPVYLLIMKADLIAGFNEFFADLDSDGRKQVWGLTLPLDPFGVQGAPLEAIRVQFSLLLDRLSQQRINRMEQERDVGKRALIFAFPQQFAALEAPLDAFIRVTFAPDRYRVQPMLRGVYWTSGTQTGTPIDRVLANVAASFGLTRSARQPFEGTGRGYFLTNLFRDLVFPEAHLAGFDARAERRRRRRRAAAIAVVLGLAMLTGVAWAISYQRNKTEIAETDQAVGELASAIASVEPTERDPVALLPLLDQARALAASRSDPKGTVALLSNLGLEQHSKLGPEAERAYRRILEQTLLPLVMLRLEEQVRGAGGDPERLYDTLRIYLMLGDPSHFEADALVYWIGRDWDRDLLLDAATEQQREDLKDHLRSLFSAAPTPLPFPLDSALVAKAREILTRTPLADRLYERIQRDGLGPAYVDFTVSEAAGDYAKLVFERRSGRSLNAGVPALYTYDGYHNGFDARVEQLIAAAAEDSWILGTETDLESGSQQSKQLADQVRQRYFRDYVAAWDDLIQDIDINAPRDLRHASEIARMLADQDQSPLRRLLAAAMVQTALDRDPAPSRSATAPEDPSSEGFRARVDRYIGATKPRTGISLNASPEAYVARRFDWLRELMETPPGEPAPFDRAQAALDRTYLLLRSMSAAAAAGRGALAAGETDEIEDLKTVAEDLPEPLSGLLGRLAQDSADIISGGMRAEMNRLWTAEILPFCREAIHDRYPFDPLSTRETTLHDFAHLFGPEGLLDSFFEANLSQLVDASEQQWKWDGAGIGIPDAVIGQFQRAAAIRQAFFPDDAKLPSAQMELTPQTLDDQSRGFVLELGGQVVQYRPAVPETARLTWPAPVAPGHAEITFIDKTGTRPSLGFTGPWAWFRLLDSAQLAETDQPELFLLTFTLAGHDAGLELRANSVRNPFQLNELRGFRCPDRL